MGRFGRLLLLTLGGLGCLGAQAQEDEDPDLDFLEYLGSWQEGDEEWLDIAEMERERVPPADGKRENGTEEDDE